MTKKLSIATLVLGVFLPASAVAPGEPTAQINTYPDGYFYSASRPYLGVDVRDITSDRVSALKLKEERGVEVTMVDQDAPAGKAGLKEQDVILEFNGARVESEEQFRRMIRETPAGRSVTLGISRDGNPMTVNVQIADKAKIETKKFKLDGNGWKIITPQAPQSPQPPDFNIFGIQTPNYTPILGIQVDNLNQQLGDYFGVKNGEGILVKSVEKGSSAEKAGMKAGDVIVRADNEKVTDRSDLRRILRFHREGGKLNLGILRDRHEQNLVIDLPARKPGDSSELEIVVPDVLTIDDLDSDLEQVVPDVDQVLEVLPTIQGAVDKALLKVKPQLLKAQTAVMQQLQPQLEKSMRKLQLQMQELQKQLQNQHWDWGFEFHDFI